MIFAPLLHVAVLTPVLSYPGSQIAVQLSPSSTPPQSHAAVSGSQLAGGGLGQQPSVVQGTCPANSKDKHAASPGLVCAFPRSQSVFELRCKTLRRVLELVLQLQPVRRCRRLELYYAKPLLTSITFKAGTGTCGYAEQCTITMAGV
jgi:hypothetical protein